MFKTARTKIISLILVGLVALGGAVYATTALAAGGASASTVTAQAAPAATESQLRSSVLDMLQVRMGLTGPEAEKFADQMIARVQGANTGFDLQSMVNWCTQFINANTNGGGSVNGGWGMMYGSGSVNGATTPGGGASNPSGASPSSPGAQNGGLGYTGRGMMGSTGYGMMGTYGLR